MKNVSRIIPCYAADTSGVCSALYEFGGMVVVHDASGCNSTYSTHDEPRWYDMKSKIYISALTEMDAVMGNDTKLVEDVCKAAREFPGELSPEFIALCGSPMPMMTGVDFDALAEEIQRQSGIKTIPLHTNGMHSYLSGAGEAFLALAKRFCTEHSEKVRLGVNILGATPLDFALNGSVESIRRWLTDEGFTVLSCFGMGSDLSEISRAAAAEVNIVISYSGLAAAEYMKDRFGIPYVCGVPIGEKFAEKLVCDLKTAVSGGKCVYPCTRRLESPSELCIIGESVFSGSLAAALSEDFGISAQVICPLDTEDDLLAEGDLQISAEEDIENALAEKRPKGVIADPLYRYIFPKGTELYPLPHYAFSGRCFAKSIPNLINTKLKELL